MHLLLHVGRLPSLLDFQVVHGERPQYLRLIPNLAEQHCLLLPLPLFLPVSHVPSQRVDAFHLALPPMHEISFATTLLSQLLGSCQHLVQGILLIENEGLLVHVPLV